MWLIIRSAVIVNYQVVADIYVPYGVDTATVLEKATAALNEYTASVHLINATAARSGMTGRCIRTALSPSICIHLPPTSLRRWAKRLIAPL
jgi:hypothetical protein